MPVHAELEEQVPEDVRRTVDFPPAVGRPAYFHVLRLHVIFVYYFAVIAGVNTVICSRCGYRDHFSKLPEECSVSRRQKDKEKRDTDEVSKERGMGKSG